MIKIEEGRLSASDLEHPDLQPLLLPLDKFDGQGSRLPGAVIKNPGGGKQKHWATCWVVNRVAKYTTASDEVRRCRRLPSPKTNRSPLTTSLLTAHHTTALRSPPPFTTSTVCPPPLCSPPCHLPSLQAAAAAAFLRDPGGLLVWREDGTLPIHYSAGMAITEAQKQAALRVLAEPAGDIGYITP